MKYKSIRAMAHNWSHSFMSANNYVEGGYVSDDIYKLARARCGKKVTINWIPTTSPDLLELSSRVRVCVLAYRATLAEHLRHHTIDASAIIELRTEIYVAENFQMHIRAFALDDRGKEHIVFVWH